MGILYQITGNDAIVSIKIYLRRITWNVLLYSKCTDVPHVTTARTHDSST